MLNNFETNILSVIAQNRELPYKVLMKHLYDQKASSLAVDVANAILGKPASVKATKIANDFITWAEALRK